MRLVNRTLLSAVSLVQFLMERFWAYERRYIKKHCATAVKASLHSPPRADEAFDVRITDVAGDARKVGESKPYVNLDSLLGDGMEAIAVFFKIRRGIRKSYKSLKSNKGLVKREAGPGFYKELKKRARDYGIDLMGFTRVPENLIFKGKCILYPNAIVCAQEMKRADMETAPEMQASVETLRVYANLGQAMNRLAEFIRSQGIPSRSATP